MPADEGDPPEPTEPPDTTGSPSNPECGNDRATGAAPDQLTPAESSRLRRKRAADEDARRFRRVVLWGGLAILALTVVVFLAWAAWPVLVTVDSGSMAPHIEEGEVLLLQTHRSVLPIPGFDAPIRSAKAARTQEIRSFGSYGTVVVFDVPDDEPPIIHRVHLRIHEGENWVKRADDSFVSGTCRDVPYCPAPHDGYITKGDANGEYDQVVGLAPPVRKEWIAGVPQFTVRILS